MAEAFQYVLQGISCASCIKADGANFEYRRRKALFSKGVRWPSANSSKDTVTRLVSNGGPCTTVLRRTYSIDSKEENLQARQNKYLDCTVSIADGRRCILDMYICERKEKERGTRTPCWVWTRMNPV